MPASYDQELQGLTRRVSSFWISSHRLRVDTLFPRFKMVPNKIMMRFEAPNDVR